MAFPKMDEMDTTTLRNRAIEKRKKGGNSEGGAEFAASPKKAMEIRKGPIAGSLPPEKTMPGTGKGKGGNFKKKSFDEGPGDDKPLGGMPGFGFSISIGRMGDEDSKAVKNREKKTGTTVPMYMQNEKSAKSGHSPKEWAEDKSQAKKMGISPAKYNTFENSHEAHRKSVRGDINKSIRQLKGK